MPNYFSKPDALVDAVNAVLSGQPTETQEDIQRKSDVKMVKVKLPDGHIVMRRERPKIEIGKGKNESLDPVDQKALKGKHSDRKDKDIDNDGDVDSSDEYLHKRRKAVSKAMKEETEDNPANRQHLCAKNVVHESWGEGSCIPTMHADPDEDGNIEWYDVMFDHGIEEQVSIEELKVTKAESHMHSSKKKIKESKDEDDDDDDMEDDDGDEDEENGKKKKVSGKKDAIDVKPEMDDAKMVNEKEMTPAQEKKREEIVLSMKKEMPRFKKKYGDRAKDVMYATATKMAMKEGFELGIEKSDLIEEVELDEDIMPLIFGGSIIAGLLPIIYLSAKEIAGPSIGKLVDKLKKNKNYKMSDSEKSDVKVFVSKVKKDKPSLLQKAMKKIKEEVELDEKLDKEDKPTVKKVVNMLKKASQAHAGQSKELQKALDEGRGRPRKDGTTGGSEDRENIQMQLRKSVSLRGLKDVEFADGKKVKVPAKVAQGVMSKINSIKDAKQKQNAVQHISKSHKHMMDFHKGDYKDADAKRQDILKLK